MNERQARLSAIGRRSRRKGKAFERTIARMLRDFSGDNWQTTRNSGRTDLAGDVYPVDIGCSSVHECKDRKDWSVFDLLKSNLGYTKEREKVIRELLSKAEDDPSLFSCPLFFGLIPISVYSSRSSSITARKRVSGVRSGTRRCSTCRAGSREGTALLGYGLAV